MKLRIAIAAFATAITSALTAAAQPFPNGADTLFIGHSFFVPISRSFDAIVEGSGSAYPQHSHQEVMSGGRSGAPGSIWQNNAKRRDATRILARGNIDLMGFTHFGEYNSGLQDYKRWIDLALSHNPNTSFMIGSPWLGGGTRLSQAEFEAGSQAAADYGWGVVQRLRREYPGTQIFHIGHGLMMPAMKADFDAVQQDDLDTLVGPKGDDSVLFTDNKLGHAGEMAKDMMALVWLNELYGVKRNVRIEWDRADANRLLREVASQNATYN